MSRSKWTTPLIIFCLALVVRLIVIPASLLRINPYSTADAVGFSNTAAFIASESSLSTPRSSTYEIWGAFLAPFWFLPGPSVIYAHIFVATLGAIAVYNIAVIGQTLYSPQAGVLASFPMAIYPSIILTHSTLLREGAVLFGLTIAARLLIARPPRLSRHWAGIGALLAIMFATIHRQENLPVYALALSSAVAVYYWNSKAIKASVIGSSIVGVAVLPILSSVVQRINDLRSRRARGRTEYLEYIQFSGLSEMIVFTWIGSMYFLFTPFPWMIEVVSDIPVAVEAAINLCYAAAAVLGFQITINRSPAIAVGLAGGLLLGVSLYGLGTVNYGTAIRHRPMFLWIIFVFGGIGIASKVRLSNVYIWN